MTNHIQITLKIDNQQWPVSQLQGQETLGGLFNFTVKMHPNDTFQFRKLNTPALLKIYYRQQQRDIAACITAINQQLSSHGQHKIQLYLEPRLALLKNNYSKHLITSTNIINAIKTILGKIAYETWQIKFLSLGKIDFNKPYYLQIDTENDYHFLQRILSDLSIYFWFMCENQQEVIVFCDSNEHHMKCSEPINYFPQKGLLTSNQQQSDIGIYHIETQWHMRPNRLHTEKQDPTKTIIANPEQQVETHGNVFYLQPGLTLQLNKKQYTVITTKHHFSTKPDDEKLAYHNLVTLIPNQQQFRNPIIKVLTMPNSLSATVFSDSHAPLLDEQGRYYIKLRNKIMPPLYKLSPYGGPPYQQQATGMHMPLRHNTTVVLNFLYGDPEQAVIIAALPKKNNKPVQDKENWFSTISNNQLVFNDQERTTAIQFHTDNQYNKLHLHTDSNQDSIQLTSQQGCIQLKAKQKVVLHSEENIKQKTLTKHYEQAEKLYSVNTQRGDIHWQTNADLSIETQQNLQLHAKRHLQFTHQKDSIIQTQKNFSLQTQGTRCQLNSTQANTYLKTDRTIKITTGTAGKICIHGPHSKIELDTSGTVTLTGRTIALQGQLLYHGQVISGPNLQLPALNTKAIQALTATLIPDIHSLLQASIQQLHWKYTLAMSDEPCYAHCMIEDFVGDEQVNFQIYQCSTKNSKQIRWLPVHFNDRYEHYDLIDSKNDTLANRTIYVMNNHEQHQPGNGVLQHTWQFKNSARENKKNNFYYYRFQVCIKTIGRDQLSAPLFLSRTLIIKPFIAINDSKLYLPELSKVSVTIDANLARQLKIDEQQFRLTNQQQQAYFQQLLLGTIECEVALQKQNLHCLNEQQHIVNSVTLDTTNTKQHTQDVACLMPPVIFNFRNDATTNDPNNRDQLTPLELNYFKQHGNRITLFIHGYNVHYGDFSADEEGVKATSFRKQQDNGTGAHHWLIQLEYWLNKASGFAGDFRYYKRIALIAWQGDPNPTLDYLVAVQESIHVATRLVKLIHSIQQQAPSMSIQLIAHSQGCATVLKALDLLAEQHSHCIEHIFLWQAAIAKTALSPQIESAFQYPISSELWYFPHAHRAVKKITILHSRNDNILGPIPKRQHAALSQTTINRSKPLTELLLALVITNLELDSVYDVAQRIGLPVSYFFSRQGQRLIYDKYLQTYPQKKTLAATLEQQIAWDRQQGHYQKSYQAIKQRWQQAPHNITRSLHEAGHTRAALLAWLTEKTGVYAEKFALLLISGSLEHTALVNEFNRMREEFDLIHVKQELAWSLIEGAITLMHLIFNNSSKPAPAMGWAGPDGRTQQQLGNKLQVIDQSAHLWTHSGMLKPNKRLFNRIFRQIFSVQSRI